MTQNAGDGEAIRPPSTRESTADSFLLAGDETNEDESESRVEDFPSESGGTGNVLPSP